MDTSNLRPELAGLAELSNRYGSDRRYVLAGGGNSSWKNGDAMYIKSSGVSLATITAGGFVGMDRRRLRAILTKPYDRSDDAKREAEVLSDMMDARLPGSDTLRPSVETLLHHLFSYTYVLHLHPALVNGMTCGARGEQAMRELFGGGAVWAPEYKPGYELSKLCERLIGEYEAEYGEQPKMVFLQNHGVFVSADTVAEIDTIYAAIMSALGRAVGETPSAAGATRSCCAPDAGSGAPSLIYERLMALPEPPSVIYHVDNPDVSRFLAGRESFRALSGAFTPDHIVYCKAYFMYFDGSADSDAITASAPPTCAAKVAAALPERYASFAAQYGYEPRVICVRGAGAFICGKTGKEADNALALFEDAVRVAAYSMYFGGPRHLSPELTDFIANWEIEHYRQKVAQSL